MNRIQSIAVVAASLSIAVSSAFIAPAAHARSERSEEIRKQLREGRAHLPEQMIVQFKAGTTEAQQAQVLARLSGKRLDALLRADRRADRKGDLVMAGLPRGKAMADAMTELEADGLVEFVEPNWVYTRQQVVQNPNDPRGAELWGMLAETTSPANPYGSGALAAWNAGQLCNSAVHVGVIDEGLMVNHTDLRSNIWVNAREIASNRLDDDRNGYINDINGWDFAGRNNSVYDGVSDDHGTHVAGTIAASANNATGVYGVCPNAKLISAKFLGLLGGTTANAVLALDYITNLKRTHNLRIVATNNSWGGGGFSQSLYDAISRANAANILFIAAAGNSNINMDVTPQYPASYNLPNVIAVAAIDSAGNRASFSNYGATRAHIAAPGVNILSTVPGSRNTVAYASYSGTSMATPHVAGAAALYASLNPCATAAQIKEAILRHAIPTAQLTGLVNGSLRLNVASFKPELTCP